MRIVLPILMIVLLGIAFPTAAPIRAQPARSAATTDSTLTKTVAQAQSKMVKIVGSGGYQGLEPYQTGMLISNSGHVLTAWSYVLDSNEVIVTMNDGQRFDGRLIGYDPRLEIAVLKIDAEEIPYFNLDEAITAELGSRILAFSNLYGVATGNEPVSVQMGVVAAKTNLSARRGAFSTKYREAVFIIDAITNNPGAAGGAVTDSRGRLVGLIGKELKDEKTSAWLNFALPITELKPSVQQILTGKMVIQSQRSDRLPSEPMTLELLGIVLVPNIVSKTPPFIDRAVVGLPAHREGLRADDLIIEINGNLTPNITEVQQQLLQIDRDDSFELTIQRRGEFMTLRLELVKRP